MNAKRIGNLFGAIVLAASGTYLFVYLYRWEWNRALVCAAFFLAAEVFLAAGAILERLRKLDAKLDDTVARRDTARRHLEATAPPARDHFAWLSPHTSEMNVFVPVLLGAGVVLSGLAWLVERLAGATARPVMEQGLASRLGPLVLPTTGFVPAPVTGGVSLLDGPALSRAREV